MSTLTLSYVDGIDGPANKNRLCVKGRFGFDYVNHPERLTKPLIRIQGKQKEANSPLRTGNSSQRESLKNYL